MLAVRHLTKSFGRDGRRATAVDGVSLDVETGQFFALLGPSGCGKTTVLRCVAGLELPDAGEVAVAGRTLFSSDRRIAIPPQDRGLGMVFQSHAVWPHMTVRENAAFPLRAAPRRLRPSRSEIDARVDRALDAVRLGRLGDRPATALSGGEQQRLALARALVTEPPLLLLDEPLSSLDAPLREEMRLELTRLQRELGITCVYVTHDQAEALSMADSVAVMRSGRILQVGDPRHVYERPTSRFVAAFIGGANLVEGVVEGPARDGYAVRTEQGLVLGRNDSVLDAGAAVTVVVRPEHVLLELGPNGAAPDGWHGVVVAHAYLGDAVEHVVALDGLELRARSAPDRVFAPGTEVAIAFADGRCSIVDADV